MPHPTDRFSPNPANPPAAGGGFIPAGSCWVGPPAGGRAPPPPPRAFLGGGALAESVGPLDPTLSVHAYSPPLTAMSYYELTGHGGLRRTRTVLTDQPEGDM